MALKFGMTPPTTPVPIKVSNGPNTGAVAAVAMSSGGVTRGEIASLAVLVVARREHDGIVTELTETFQHIACGQPHEKLDRDTILEARNNVAYLGFVVLIRITRACHQDEPSSLRTPLQRLFDGGGKIVVDGDADHIGGKRRLLSQERPGDAHVHNWRQRKELSPVAQHKIDRLIAPRDNHVWDLLRILCPQERHQGAMISLGVELGNVEILGVHHGAWIRFR